MRRRVPALAGTASLLLTDASPVLKRPFVIVAALVALLVIAGFAFLATWNIPAPSARVEKVVPNDRLPR